MSKYCDECTTNGPCGTVKVDHDASANVVAASRAVERLRPGSREFIEILDDIARMHLGKCQDYGCTEDAFSNIRMGGDLLNVPAWQTCLLRIGDKIHRLREYIKNGKMTFDGFEDTCRDIASYAVIMLATKMQDEEKGVTDANS